MLKNQPNKMGTPQHIHTIPTSCAILPTMHNKKLFTHSLNEHSTQHCSLHSLPHKRQSTSGSATFSSSNISQHNLNQHTIQSITAHSFCVQDRLYLPCSIATIHCSHLQHNTLHAHQHAQHTAIPFPLPSTTLLCTQPTNTKHSWQNRTRCRDGVNVLWCCFHLVWLVFEHFIPTCACFHSENFFCDFILIITTVSSTCLQPG